MSSRSWYAGWNTPGCLPEVEPAEFTTWEEAFGHIETEIADVFVSLLDDVVAENDEPVREWAPAMDALNTMTRDEPFVVHYHGLSWWVADLPAGLSTEGVTA